MAVLSALKERALSNDYSPEGFIKDLGDRSLSRGVLLVDEAGRLLSTMRTRGYGERLKDILTNLWDVPPTQSRKLMNSTFVLTEPYISLLMATTISWFAETTSAEDISSGFLARFLPVVVTKDVARRDLVRRGQNTTEMEQTLYGLLAETKARLARAPGPTNITDGALVHLNRAERALEGWAKRQFHADLIGPWSRRLAEYGGLLALIFAVSEGQNEVDRPQMLRAIRVIDRAKEGLKRRPLDFSTPEALRKSLARISDAFARGRLGEEQARLLIEAAETARRSFPPQDPEPRVVTQVVHVKDFSKPARPVTEPDNVTS